MKPIKILHLLPSLRPGGAETNLLGLLELFSNDRFEHAVGYWGNGSMEDEFKKTGVRMIRMSSKPLNFRSIFRMLRPLNRVRAYGPDIIHSHLDLTNGIALTAKLFFNCRVVLHFHGLGIIKHKYLPERNRKHLIWNIVSRTYKYCDKAIAICTFQYPFLRSVGFDMDKVVLIPNGIAIHDDKYSIRKNGNKDFQFVNVGRFFPQKNHDLLLRSFLQVRQVIPNIRLVLVGDGPLKERTEERAREFGLEKKIDFLGIRRDIQDILAQSDCFILNSRWELHPISILEAMVAGLPVIASKVGGVPETVEDRVTGWLVPPMDQNALTQAMVEAAADRHKAAVMGCRGKRLVAEKFSNALVTKRFESLYKGMTK